MSTATRLAVRRDWGYIESLRRKEGAALGFIPKDRYLSILEERPSSGRNRWRYERIWLTEDGGEPTGFCYVAFAGRTGTAKLWQVCVQEDARRWHRALLLTRQVEDEARRRGLHSVEARVAADLEANLFWQAAGYDIVESLPSTFLGREDAKSGRLLLVYRKLLSNILQPSLWSGVAS